MLNWGLIGSGGITYVFCNGTRFSNTGQILAVASRAQSRADRLITDFAISSVIRERCAGMSKQMAEYWRDL